MSVALLTGLLMLITFEYEDVDSLTAWSLNFWDLFFKGRLDEFYEYTALNVHGAAHGNCGGNYLWLLPLCVWNLPLWVVHSVSGIISVQNIYSICWTKLFWFLMQIVTAYVSGKICAMMTSDQDKISLTVLLVMASPEILISVGYAGQDEIVYICFFIIAFYCFLKGYWKRCYILMICSVSFCPIMLIPSLALLFIKEKKIHRLLIYASGMILPLVLFELFYRSDAVYQSVKHNNDFVRMMSEMLSGLKLDTVWGAFSAAGIVLCVLFFLCYVDFLPQDQSKEYIHRIVYIFTLFFMIISLLMIYDFYRMFIYVPFLVILIMTTEQNIGINLFLLVVMTYGRIFQACRGSYPKNMNTCYIMKNSWITALCDYVGSTRYLADPEHSTCLWAYLYDWGELLEIINLLVGTCVLGTALILLVINRIGCKKKYEPMFRKNIMLVVYTLCMPIVLICYYIMLLH